MKRIVVIGNSSSGKTTSSRKLATLLDVPLLELDGVFHQPDWTELPDDQFRSRVARFTDNDRWVVDGNYTSHGMRDVLWPKADSIVWLDMPKSVVTRRVVARTIRRAASRKSCGMATVSHGPISTAETRRRTSRDGRGPDSIMSGTSTSGA